MDGGERWGRGDVGNVQVASNQEEDADRLGNLIEK